MRIDARTFDLLPELTSLLGHHPGIIGHHFLVVHLRPTMLFAEGTIQILRVVVALVLTLIEC